MMARGHPIKTYVDGLDERLHGGLPHGHAVLISGTPGTMKSTLAYYILYHNARAERKEGIYITFEQTRDSLIAQMNALGLPYDVVKDYLTILDMATMRGEIDDFGVKTTWVQMAQQAIKETYERHGADIIAFDSLGIFQLVAGLDQPRAQLYQFLKRIKQIGATSMWISEMDGDTQKYARWDEDFLMDGVIHITQQQRRETDFEFWTRVVKMRGIAHEKNFLSLNFGANGFSVSKIISDEKLK
jgi:KaiC/GvpD/RAD55 family RecA-like ATPase